MFVNVKNAGISVTTNVKFSPDFYLSLNNPRVLNFATIQRGWESLSSSDQNLVINFHVWPHCRSSREDQSDTKFVYDTWQKQEENSYLMAC